MSNFRNEKFKSDWLKARLSLNLDFHIFFTIDKIFLKYLLTEHKKEMKSVKKQILSLCKFYSFHEEIPEEFLDETDVDKYFYYNVFHISQSQHRIVRNSKGSNKKCSAIKLFELSSLKTQQRYIL